MRITRKPAEIRTALLLSICAPALILAGCGRPLATRVEAAKESGHDARGAAVDPLPGGITGTHWYIPWRTTDPKNPRAKPVTVLIADAGTGTMTDRDNNVALRLGDVRAQLFSEGRHVANLKADQVDMDRHSQIVVATGNVRLVSLTDPPDTVLTADSMTWDTHTKILVATGNAHFVQNQPNKPGADVTDQSIKYNIATGDIVD